MNFSKVILPGILSIAVLGLGAIAWHEYRELIVLRSEIGDSNPATLKKELADARKTIRQLEERIAAMRGRWNRGGANGADGEQAAGPDGAARQGGRFGAFGQLANNPEFQRLMSIQMKARLNQTYGPLFKQLNLTPDQLAQFQSLLADKQQALMDTLQAAREQGINPRTDPDGFKTLVGQAEAQLDTSIQQTLGDAGYQQYQQYQQTLPERNVVNSLQQALSYTQTPLTDDQANQMVQVLAQTQPQRAGNGTNGTDANAANVMSMLNGGGNARVTDDSVTQAEGVLSGPQMSALQQIQQQQQAQQQLRQLMRGANGGGAPAAPTGGSGGKG